MPLPEFSPVRLATDRFAASEGVGRGAIGFILDVFPDGYIVEFSGPDGATISWFGVDFEDVEAAPEVMETVSDRSSV